MTHRWGTSEKTVIHSIGYIGSFLSVVGLLAYTAVWLLMLGVIVGISALIGVLSLVLMMVWLPCCLWHKASEKARS
jgi:hypothetical protein